MELLLYICLPTLIFVVGYIVGSLVSDTSHKRVVVGDLRVDRSDPTDRPYLFLELESDLAYVLMQDEVALRVKIENFITQK